MNTKAIAELFVSSLKRTRKLVLKTAYDEFFFIRVKSGKILWFQRVEIVNQRFENKEKIKKVGDLIRQENLSFNPETVNRKTPGILIFYGGNEELRVYLPRKTAEGK